MGDTTEIFGYILLALLLLFVVIGAVYLLFNFISTLTSNDNLKEETEE
jgi:hypothetical protein